MHFFTLKAQKIDLSSRTQKCGHCCAVSKWPSIIGSHCPAFSANGYCPFFKFRIVAKEEYEQFREQIQPTPTGCRPVPNCHKRQHRRHNSQKDHNYQSRPTDCLKQLTDARPKSQRTFINIDTGSTSPQILHTLRIPTHF